MVTAPPPPPPLPPPPAPVTVAAVTSPQHSRAVVDVESGVRSVNDKPPPPWFITTMNLLNTITHLSLGAISFFAIFIGSIIISPDSLRQHIYLCVTGYIILMSQAVLSMNPYNGWSRALKQQEKRAVHWIMQIVGSSLAIAGSIIRIVDMENGFQTAHGIFGLIAMLLTFVSFISGVVNLFSETLRLPVKIIKICHAVLGSLTLSVAFISLCLAFNTEFFKELIGEPIADTAIVLTVIALFGSLISAFVRIFERIFHWEESDF